MRRPLALARTVLVPLACALALAACGGSPGPERSKWVGAWTLEKDRTAKSVVEYGKADRERMRTMMKGAGRSDTAGAPKGRDPPDEALIAQARGWMEGMKADLDLRSDGTATADLYFGGLPVTYTGTWSEVGTGAEMKIVSRAEGILQGRDLNPLRFTRDAEFLTIGGELDAQGAPRPVDEQNTVVPLRRMYLARK
jgi:hypothetical protein